jgi:hypothetical protein
MRNNSDEKRNRFDINRNHMGAGHIPHHRGCRIHRTLRVTPAMQAGLADHVWEIEELVALLD